MSLVNALNRVGAGQGKIMAYVLVRDKKGRPKVDDPASVPQEVWDKLSESDKQWILRGK